MRKLSLFCVDFILVVLDRFQCDHSTLVVAAVMTIRTLKT